MRTSRSTAAMPEDIARVLSKADAIPIRTRGPLPYLTTQVGSGPTTLRNLVDELRPQPRLPLTFVIHDWGTRPSDDFFSELKPWLDDWDGLWLVNPPGWQGRSEPTRGVVLKLGDKDDERLYGNLWGDLVFFTGQEADFTWVNTWKHRARSIVVDIGGPYSDIIGDEFVDSNRIVYERYENGELKVKRFVADM